MVEKKTFWSIYREALSVTWPNFTVVKYNLKISNVYNHNEQTFHKKAVFKSLVIFTDEHLCCSLFFNENAGLRSCSFIKKRLQHRCFPLNIATFLKTPVLKNICERLFECFPTWIDNITSNIWSAEDISKRKESSKSCKTQLDEKNLPFHDALDHFVFLYLTNECQAAFALNSKNSANFSAKHQRCRFLGLQPATLLKSDSNTSAFL